MHKTITIEEAQLINNPIYVDVRSPLEFSAGHVINAVNIPLFTDDERAKIGTIYKNNSVEEAKELGLSIVSTKLPDIFRQIREYHNTGRTIIIYCWRGGMRSKSIVNVLELMGIETYQLVGGYKIYRRYILDTLTNFNFKPKVILLCGSTGVGKTTLLEILKRKNIPIIDLEKLANHRGSVFGKVGLGKSVTAQNFDATLLEELKLINNKPYVAIECESKRIGNVYLPNFLYNAMQIGVKILLYTDLEIRITRLINEYTNLYSAYNEEIINALSALSKRLGEKKTNNLITLLQQGNTRSVVGTLLTDYYDRLYGYENSNREQYDLTVNCDDLEKASIDIINYLENMGR